MEMTLYDDSMYRPQKPEPKSLKRPVTLNLESPDTLSKKQRFAAILTSPDLQMLKLASPELERFIISNGNITTTPTPTSFMFSKNVTEEQEQYARGFIDALNHLHQTQFEMNTGGLITRISTGLTPMLANPPDLSSVPDVFSMAGKSSLGPPPFYFQHQASTSVIKSLGSAKALTAPKSSSLLIRPPSVDNNNSNSSNSLSSASMPLEIAIKEELQSVPSEMSTPPLSPIGKGPIDMAEQERIKLERKRYRNRVAASKCRKRKLEKISQLEEKVNELKGENNRLELQADRLRDEVTNLKSEVLEHVRKGCQIMLTKRC